MKSPRLPKGILTLSIDLAAESPRPGLNANERAAEQRLAERSLDEVSFWLLEVLKRYDMSATWAVADPQSSETGARIRSLGVGHEIAVLGESTWVGREAGRTRFGRELAQRTSGGPAISTLVLRSGELGEQCDLAIRQGVTAVRHTVRIDAPESTRLEPRTLRYGLWSFPVSLTLPGTTRWLPGGGGLRAARNGIDRAIDVRGLFQLVIDAPRLIGRGRPAQRILERVLEHAAWRRRQGEIDVESLRAAAEKLSNPQPSQPTRSILRPAA